MKLNSLKELVKEELTKAINENTPKYKEGDTFNYMGTKHTVVSDSGYVVKAKLSNGKVVRLNYGQLKDRVSENEATRDLKDMPLENMEEGTYKIEYMTQADGGGGDMVETTTYTVTKNEFMENMDLSPSSFWKGIARKNMAEGVTYCRGGAAGTELNYIEHFVLIDRPVDKSENYIKRCVAIAKDCIEIKNSILYVNDKPAFIAENQCLLYFVDKSTATFPTAEEMFEKYGLEYERGDFKAPETMEFSDKMEFSLQYNVDPNKEFYAFNISISEKNRIQKDFPKAKFTIAIAKKSASKNNSN